LEGPVAPGPSVEPTLPAKMYRIFYDAIKMCWDLAM